MRTLLVAAGSYDGAAPGSRGRAIVVEGDRISWVGDDPAGAPAVDETQDLGSTWITPAFVDAHVHGTWTGFSLEGVQAARATSREHLLVLVREHAAAHADRSMVIGMGWEETRWPQQRPPTAQELTAAAGGRPVLLIRVDGHSCLVDRATLDLLPLDRIAGVDRDADGSPSGWLKEEASETAQSLLREQFTARDLTAARRAACGEALRLGIGAIHEMGHPGLAGIDDARAWRDGDWPLDVQVWWAELDFDRAAREGFRPGGDLFLDGSIGSCTAATSQLYGEPASNGELFHDDAAVAEWFTVCTAAGMGGGVHAIGDRAIEQALVAIERAADARGRDAVRACRHRIEHVELPTPEQVTRMARLGVVASVQPAFDATWGGDTGLYADRFGLSAARASNPFGWFAEEGVPMAFGSDSTVTPLDPWGGVASAVRHLGGLGVDWTTSLRAHTAGGHFVGGQDDVGTLRPGQRADLAVWSADPSVEDISLLRCMLTMVRGRVVHQAP